MTIHFHEDVPQCTACGKSYLPYAEGHYQCPNCGAQNDPVYNFSSMAASSIQFNLDNYYTYHPMAWMATSKLDEVISVLFNLFTMFKEQKEYADYNTFVSLKIEELPLDPENEYLREHIRHLSVAVFNRLVPGGTKMEFM